MKQRDSDREWLKEWQQPDEDDEQEDDDQDDVAPGSLGVESEGDEDRGLTFVSHVSKEAIRGGRWKYEFDPVNLNADDLDNIYDEEEARGKYKSHRTYIGPDSETKESDLSIANKPDHEKVGYHRTGEDKIAVEVRYNNQDNKVTYHGAMSHYKKTTFVKYPGKEWILVSRHQDIKSIEQLKDKKGEKPERTLVFVHPPKESGSLADGWVLHRKNRQDGVQ